MDQHNKENYYFQPCENPLERKIFRGKWRRPEREPETNTRLFESVYSHFDSIRKRLTDKGETFSEEYSEMIVQNLKAYLEEVFNSQEYKSIQTTVNFDPSVSGSKASYFDYKSDCANSVPVRPKIEESEIPRAIQEKPLKKSSVYQSVLLQNTRKLHRYKY